MTTIRLHDSMAREKRVFTPIDAANVRLYVCGPTVYDRAHIGNGRAAVGFDVLYRLLRHVYGDDHVTFVRNITDIDDKIIARAHETGRAIETITAETTQWYLDDMKALGCLTPTAQPCATEHVRGMVAMMERLIATGHAYEAEGHVLFAVDSYADYGRLSGRSLDDMIAGARVEVAPYKRGPMDFVLWKPSTPEQPGWHSPWGRGRPGWHIECSVMAEAFLGRDFDIHGGGSDLMFPHHENEIAQSCCAYPGHGFARYWMHNGMLTVDGRKMSKSLGNFFTVRHKLDEGLPGQVIRLAMLMTHYRDALDWTEQRVGEARTMITVWEKLLTEAGKAGLVVPEQTRPDQQVLDALADDLNVSQALVRLRELATLLKLGESDAFGSFVKSLEILGINPLGFREHSIRQGVEHAFTTLEAMGAKIDALLISRAEARAARDFGKADAIRHGLDAAGVVVMDRPGAATEWELGPAFDAAKLAEMEP